MEGNSGKRKRQTKELRWGSIWELRNGDWSGVYGVGGGDGNEVERQGVHQLTDICDVSVRSVDLFWKAMENHPRF